MTSIVFINRSPDTRSIMEKLFKVLDLLTEVAVYTCTTCDELRGTRTVDAELEVREPTFNSPFGDCSLTVDMDNTPCEHCGNSDFAFQVGL